MVYRFLIISLFRRHRLWFQNRVPGPENNKYAVRCCKTYEYVWVLYTYHVFLLLLCVNILLLPQLLCCCCSSSCAGYIFFSLWFIAPGSSVLFISIQIQDIFNVPHGLYAHRMLPLLLLLLLLCVAVLLLLLLLQKEQYFCFLLLFVIVCRTANFGACLLNLIYLFSLFLFKQTRFVLTHPFAAGMWITRNRWSPVQPYAGRLHGFSRVIPGDFLGCRLEKYRNIGERKIFNIQFFF